MYTWTSSETNQVHKPVHTICLETHLISVFVFALPLQHFIYFLNANSTNLPIKVCLWVLGSTTAYVPVQALPAYIIHNAT